MPNVGPGPSHGAWLVDPGWYGRVVVEAEGTNEGLADLQARCGRAFPPRAVGARASGEKVGEERNMVFRILRERRYVLVYVSRYINVLTVFAVQSPW